MTDLLVSEVYLMTHLVDQTGEGTLLVDAEVQVTELLGPEGDTLVIESVEQGPPGPPGPAGPQGAAGGTVFQHNQLITPAATWVVNHNFGRYVDVAVFSPGGREVLAEVLQASLNQVQILFDNPQTGFAICS